MHWLLSVPDTFSLRQVIRRSGSLVLPSLYARPMRVHVTPSGVPVAPTDAPVAPATGHLYRIESLGDVAVELDIYQAPAGLVIHTDLHLSGLQIQEASEKVWRMLRLDEDYQPFLRLAQNAAGLKAVQRSGARLLRGTTLFEDVITAALATWSDQGVPHFERVRSLVDRIGIALPRNPTLHAFPEPERVLAQLATLPEGLTEVLGPEAVVQVEAIATAFADPTPRGTAPEILAPLHCTASIDDITSFLTSRFALSAPSRSLLMLNLGYYDYIPTDAAAVRRFSLAHGVMSTPEGVMSTPEGKATPQDLRQRLRAQFELWQPWGGLAYWLWDWTVAPALQDAAHA